MAKILEETSDAGDILSYARVHHKGNQETDKEDMHAPIIGSRTGVIRSSLARSLTTGVRKKERLKVALTGSVVHTCEPAFDQQESFAYCHALKNGGVTAIREQAQIRVEQEQQRRPEQLQVEKAQRQKQQIKEVPQQRRSRGIGR